MTSRKAEPAWLKICLTELVVRTQHIGKRKRGAFCSISRWTFRYHVCSVLRSPVFCDVTLLKLASITSRRKPEILQAESCFRQLNKHKPPKIASTIQLTVWLCVILKFRHEVDENCPLLCCYAASSGNSSSTFRYNPSFPSSSVNNTILGLSGTMHESHFDPLR